MEKTLNTQSQLSEPTALDSIETPKQTWETPDLRSLDIQETEVGVGGAPDADGQTPGSQ